MWRFKAKDELNKVVSYQSEYSKKGVKRISPNPLILLVRLTGFEPVAYCLEGSCSIRLSYRRIMIDMLIGRRKFKEDAVTHI